MYEGEFSDDVVTGLGKFSYPSGAYYDGQWVNGLYNGLGKYCWPDGRSYEVRLDGRFSDIDMVLIVCATVQEVLQSRRCQERCMGQIEYSVGHVGHVDLLHSSFAFQGAWVDNKMHGHGVFTDARGHKWEGDFHNGSGPGLTCDLR